MKKISKVMIVTLLYTCVIGCDDVFEENISDDVILAISPKGDEVIESNTVNFQWSSLDGANEFRIQILKKNTEAIVVDSLLSDNFLALPLVSGNYDWRVRGENFAYQTGYSFVESFVVESTNDLSDQNVFLNSPNEDIYINYSSIELDWLSLDAANSYTLQVNKNVNGVSSTVLLESDIVTTNYNLDSEILDEDAVYTWRIHAVNDISQTNESIRTLFLDTTLPNQPILATPENDSTVFGSVDFIWNLGIDTGEVQSLIESVIEISSDENFGTIISISVSDDDTYQYTFDSVGQYYWRVKAIDEAGNEGVFSNVNTLTVE